MFHLFHDYSCDGWIGPAPPLQQKTAASPEHQARESERVVNRLIEESASANLRGDMALALEKVSNRTSPHQHKHHERWLHTNTTYPNNMTTDRTMTNIS